MERILRSNQAYTLLSRIRKSERIRLAIITRPQLTQRGRFQIRHFVSNDVVQTIESVEFNPRTQAFEDAFEHVKSYLNVANYSKAEDFLMSLDLSKIHNPIGLFNRLLIAYCDVHQYKDVSRLFNRLYRDSSLPSPDSQSFNIYLKVLPVDQREAVLKIMIEKGLADLTSFNYLIASYCEEYRPEDAERIMNLLNECSKTSPGLKPTAVSFAPMIRLASRIYAPKYGQAIFDAMRCRGIEPDHTCWSIIIHAWASSKTNKARENAVRLFEQMELTLEPDAELYNIVLLAIANGQNRGPDAEAFLRRMRVPPTIVSFSTCLLAWKNSADMPIAEQRALALIEEMEDKYGLKPNEIMFTTMIGLYAQTKSPEKAEKLFATIENPNTVHYTALLDAWARSGSLHSIPRGLEILSTMTQSPSDVTFETMIHLLCNSHDSTRALLALNAVLEIMRQNSFIPSGWMYTGIFNICGKAPLREEALIVMRYVFGVFLSNPPRKVDKGMYDALFRAVGAHQAPFDDIAWYTRHCQEGNAVTPKVLRCLRTLCSKEEFQKLFQDGHDDSRFS